MLPKISSEIQVFKFEYPSYGHYLREDPWLFVEAKRGPREKKNSGNIAIAIIYRIFFVHALKFVERINQFFN